MKNGMDTPAASTFGGRLVSGGVYEGHTATLLCTLAACLSAGAAVKASRRHVDRDPRGLAAHPER
jgi:hypothetical protein